MGHWMLAHFQRPGRSNLLTIIMKWNAVVMQIKCEPGVGTCKMITPYIRKEKTTTQLIWVVVCSMQVFFMNLCKLMASKVQCYTYNALLWERERANQKDSKLKHGWTFQEFDILTSYMFLIESFILIQLVCLFYNFLFGKRHMFLVESTIVWSSMFLHV